MSVNGQCNVPRAECKACLFETVHSVIGDDDDDEEEEVSSPRKPLPFGNLQVKKSSPKLA